MPPTPKWRGDDKMQAEAITAEKDLATLYGEMSAQEKVGMVKFLLFWTTYIGAGHKNIFKMARELVKASGKPVAEDDTDQ